VCGVPVTVKVLRVSVAEPDAFLAALQHGSQG
jgi:hypothetical protein